MQLIVGIELSLSLYSLPPFVYFSFIRGETVNDLVYLLIIADLCQLLQIPSIANPNLVHPITSRLCLE